MLAFTPDVRDAMRWFDLTHDLQPGLVPRWTRIALPAAGALGDQEARLMAMLGYLQTVMNETLLERKDPGTAVDELAAFRQENGRNQR